MQEIMLMVEKHGLAVVGLLGVSYALYKAIMYMLVQKAKVFEESHAELKRLVKDDLERLDRIETKLTDHIGDQKVFRELITQLLKDKK
jgi:hypothetical protein